ncbi:hypothetical protein SO221_004463 [Salmonella enterica]|nr:hypothetical protein [Salmonella enterica]
MGSIDGKALSEMGRRSRASGDYWEQLLGLEDTARLMQIRISDLRLAVLSGKMINGKLPPKIHSVSGGGHFFFDGQEIKEWLALKND